MQEGPVLVCDDDAIIPPVPETIEEAGLSESIIEQLILKNLFFKSEILGRDLASSIGFKFSLIEAIMESFKHQHLVQVKRSLGMGNASSVFTLSEAGRNLAREFLELNQYVGPAPVPLFQYSILVRKQRRKPGWLTPENLAQTYRRMVLTPELLARLGPAVGSGNSFLIYGQPGNGKTYLAEALVNLDDEYIYIPHALECQGHIVQVYDPIYHQRVDDEESYSVFACEPSWDKRFVRCRRPFIVTGGELSLEMLDLTYNSTSKVYDAPFQVKANNGIYLIDDFGRQRATPAEVLNRWIVPMERRVDYLSFHSGGKMTVPFEAFLIFSTNLRPDQLGDEAFLRRIQYKMLMRSPDGAEFAEIFRQYCRTNELAFTEGQLERFIDRHYRRTAKPFRRCHPRDVLSHAVNLIHFEKRPHALTDELLDRAFASCFLEETDE
jgi:predicted ATPase with chaperone activity